MIDLKNLLGKIIILYLLRKMINSSLVNYYIIKKLQLLSIYFMYDLNLSQIFLENNDTF